MGRTILITGGAGTLGRAFVALLSPENEVIVVDSSEWAIAELKRDYPGVECILGDFVEYPLSGYEDIIIHAAAYKHVDLGERQPTTFVTNNLTKTIELYEKVRQGITRVLYISTDKAVEPISVYGATKFLAERLTFELGGQVARLGNLLSSSGSVIPLWEKAIAEQRPIPVTDPEMTRYVLEADDAAVQVWAQFLEGRRLCIPEMGDPKRILDILSDVIKRHGYEGVEDYSPGVEIVGKRAGEKRAEKLVWDSETL